MLFLLASLPILNHSEMAYTDTNLHKNSKVFVVGAGGIGCELLKNLVLTGFTNLHVIDLDTIDVSNLNRQFLFQRQHVGQSKSLCATNTVKLFNPNVNITTYHDRFEWSTLYFSAFGIDCYLLGREGGVPRSEKLET